MTKIHVSSARLTVARFIPVNGHRPQFSVPIEEVKGFSVGVGHSGFFMTHGSQSKARSFTVEVVPLDEFCEQGAINLGLLIEIFSQTHKLLTRDQAFHLLRTCSDKLPAKLVLLPTKRQVNMPGYAEPMCLAQGVEWGRKSFRPKGFVRHSQSSMLLVSSRTMFTEDTCIAGIKR